MRTEEECEYRVYLREEQDSPEGEFLLCTECHWDGTKGCVCHSVCSRCGDDDLIRQGPVSGSEPGPEWAKADIAVDKS